MQLFLLVACVVAPVGAAAARPNIVFLIDESTDGRTYRPDVEYMHLTNIRKLTSEPQTVQFDGHYVSAPVCACSRASIWSGRYPHNIPHDQARTGLPVKGAWNNFEGLPGNYSSKIHDVLALQNYDIHIAGKTDWSTGGHSLDNRLEAWTMYVQFPYNQSTGGFYDEGPAMCQGNGTVNGGDTPNEGGYYSSDWKPLNATQEWIRNRSSAQHDVAEQAGLLHAAAAAAAAHAAKLKCGGGGAYCPAQQKDAAAAAAIAAATSAAAAANAPEPTPFFAYQGMDIVHPAYFTNQYWYDKVNQSAVTAPAWKPLSELHPCDYQASMLKGCIPLAENVTAFAYSEARRKRVRSIYYAMILEFDSMVGVYMDTLDDAGIANNTILIVTSDHGDMNMEHQQFYKMVQYDASARVPLVIRLPPGSAAVGNPFVTAPTSHVDLFPTIMDFAQVPGSSRPSCLQGESLAPFLAPKTVPNTGLAAAGGSDGAAGEPQPQLAVTGTSTSPRRAFNVIQFHGCDIAMSWFSIVDGTYKYTVFGTGEQHPPQLFNMLADPGEDQNIAATEPATIKRLDAWLRTVVDYPAVAMDVAQYNHDSLSLWVNSTKDWKSVAAKSRWKASFDVDTNASIAAISEYVANPAAIKECRNSKTWPKAD